MNVIQNFFKKYAEVSMSGTPAQLSAFYGKHFVMAGPDGSEIFKNDARFLRWLKHVHDFNVETGLKTMNVQKVTSTEISQNLMMASVNWGGIYEKTGNEIIKFDIHYTLERFKTDLKILLVVSDEDQGKLMKEKGLL